MSFAYSIANVWAILKHRCNVVLFLQCSKPYLVQFLVMRLSHVSVSVLFWFSVDRCLSCSWCLIRTRET